MPDDVCLTPEAALHRDFILDFQVVQLAVLDHSFPLHSANNNSRSDLLLSGKRQNTPLGIISAMCECGKRCGIDHCILRPSVRILFILVCCSIGLPDMAKYDVGKLMGKATPELVGIPPLAVSPTTILLPSRKVAPCRKEPFKCGRNTRAIPQFSSIFFIFGQNSAGSFTVIFRSSGIAATSPLMLIGSVCIPRA